MNKQVALLILLSFFRQINGLHLKDVSINWRNTQMPYFTHGIELQNFSNVVV